MGLASKVELEIWEAGEPEKLRFPRNGGDPLETGGGTGPGEATRPRAAPSHVVQDLCVVSGG